MRISKMEARHQQMPSTPKVVLWQKAHLVREMAKIDQDNTVHRNKTLERNEKIGSERASYTRTFSPLSLCFYRKLAPILVASSYEAKKENGAYLNEKLLFTSDSRREDVRTQNDETH